MKFKYTCRHHYSLSTSLHTCKEHLHNEHTCKVRLFIFKFPGHPRANDPKLELSVKSCHLCIWMCVLCMVGGHLGRVELVRQRKNAHETISHLTQSLPNQQMRTAAGASKSYLINIAAAPRTFLCSFVSLVSSVARWSLW